MAGKTTAKRKPAAKPAAKAPAAKGKPAAAKPKAAAKPAPKPAKAKPAAVVPKAAALQTAPASSGLALVLAKDVRQMAGCGFGIDQSIMLGAIDVTLPPKFDFDAIEPLLEEFAIAAPDKARPMPDMAPEVALVGRIHAWHAAIQRGVNVPVFGGCRLWDRGVQPDGARRVSFAVPSAARPASVAALQFVIDAILALASGGEVTPELRQRYKALYQVLARHQLNGINPIHFLEAAHALGIEHTPWSDQMWMFGLGRHRLLLSSTVTSATPYIGVAMAKDKLKCSAVLRGAGLPVADSGWARNVETAIKLADKIGYPVVVKPANADQGQGVTAGIEDEAELRRAFAAAAKISQRVMVEKHHFGRDYRVTVLHGKVIKVMDRRPGGVTGDGKSTVAQLVEASNEHDRAMRAKLRKQRAPMLIDEEAQKLLGALGYSDKTVVPEGEFVALRRRANISAGGTYEILPPDALHPDNRLLALNATATLALDLAGIDIISGDPAKSWRETGGIIVEVNAQPQIGYRDTETIYGEILVSLIGGKGDIPVHLLVLQDGLKVPTPLPELAARANCNAAALGKHAWIDGAGALGPFANGFRAGRGILQDTRVNAAVIAMSEQDVLRAGLPAARFASIRLIGETTWQPAPNLQQLIAAHSPAITRQELSQQARQPAPAATG